MAGLRLLTDAGEDVKCPIVKQRVMSMASIVQRETSGPTVPLPMDVHNMHPDLTSMAAPVDLERDYMPDS